MRLYLSLHPSAYLIIKATRTSFNYIEASCFGFAPKDVGRINFRFIFLKYLSIRKNVIMLLETGNTKRTPADAYAINSRSS
jgi:hypothetical protein